MRTLAVTQNITIDGVIDLAGGWFSPGDDSAGLAEVNEVLQKQAAGADSLLLGRVSFEDMRPSGPGKATTQQATPIISTASTSSWCPPPWRTRAGRTRPSCMEISTKRSRG